MVTAHPDCGAPVVLVGGEIRDPDGGEHYCRDYVVWHLPADPRHPDEMPWPAAAPAAGPSALEVNPAPGMAA